MHSVRVVSLQEIISRGSLARYGAQMGAQCSVEVSLQENVTEMISGRFLARYGPQVGA